MFTSQLLNSYVAKLFSQLCRNPVGFHTYSTTCIARTDLSQHFPYNNCVCALKTVAILYKNFSSQTVLLEHIDSAKPCPFRTFKCSAQYVEVRYWIFSIFHFNSISIQFISLDFLRNQLIGLGGVTIFALLCKTHCTTIIILKYTVTQTRLKKE